MLKVRWPASSGAVKYQERADGLMPSAQSLRECECAGRKHTSANLDPYGDWIEICSDAQNLKTHLPIISILSPFRGNLSRDTPAVLVLNCCRLHIYAARTVPSF